MDVKRVVVGYLSENCYLINDGKEGIIVDPGDEIEKIVDMISDIKVIGILITHNHFDHVGALENLLKIYDVPIYYHNINNELAYEKIVDVEEKEYSINSFKFKVIYTPGHRNDSTTFYFYEDEIMFTGDFLFYLSVGRCDLEYGNHEEMLESIKLIKNYPDDIKIYPGHSSETTLGFEKKYNDFLCE